MVVTLLALAMSGAAYAVDVDSFAPSGSTFAGTGGLQVAAPGFAPAGTVSLATELVYARRPLVERWADGTVAPLVDSQFATRLLGGYTFGAGVRLDVDVPLYPLVVAGDDAGFAVGDLRVGAQVPLQLGDDVTLGLQPVLLVPTGREDRYVGAGGIGGGGTLAVAARLGESVRLDLEAGAVAEPTGLIEDVALGSQGRAGVGLAWLPAQGLELGLEGTGRVDLAEGFGGEGQAPIEAHAYGAWASPSGFTALLGGGAGMRAGVGAPELRIVGGVGWRSGGKPAVRDADGDGVLDAADACPAVPEDVDGYQDVDGCPEPDNDADSLLDGADRCPDEAEDMDGFEDGDGCPDVDDDHDGVLDSMDTCPRAAGPVATGGCPDGDGDGVTDAKDTCPAVAGPAATGGCPDRDGDGVADAVDACPDQPIEPERLGTGDGCPSVRVDAAAGKVTFEGTVTFEPGTARLTAEAGPLLDKIAVVLVAHPELKRLEVGGHTDSDGDTRSNLRLSRDRAQAVVDYLVHQGVSPSRLVARGYGETVPVDTNLTTKGRARNRRVEITILP